MRVRVWMFVGFACAATIAAACCSVSFPKQVVMFSGQANIIVWDADTNTEHFIRKAKFSTEAKDLGFIAPTPSEPKLEEVNPKAFKTLVDGMNDYYRKMRVKEANETKGTESAGSSPKTVQVVSVTRVAGYGATVLKATDASGLAKWMKARGYATSPSIEKWTDFYIKKGWYFTAFKVLADYGKAETGLVKMSFKTDQPFNPYYVPMDNIPKEGSPNEGLQVFFVGPGEYEELTRSDSFYKDGKSAPLYGGFARDLQRQLKLSSLPRSATVSLFRDTSFPNEDCTADIYFHFTGPQPEMPPIPIETWAIGGVVTAVVGFGVAKLWRRRKALP